MRSKLDCCFGNVAFFSSSGTLNVRCLPIPSLDHHAIILTHSQQSTRDGKSLHKMDRLEPWWMGYFECTTIIQEQWNGTARMSPQAILESLNGLKSKLRGWSRKTFGTIPKEIKQLRQHLLRLERTGGIEEQLRLAQNKLEQLIEAEHDYWR